LVVRRWRRYPQLAFLSVKFVGAMPVTGMLRRRLRG
jgi:hypothetical protein